MRREKCNGESRSHDLYMVNTFQNLNLQNQWANCNETLDAAFGPRAYHRLVVAKFHMEPGEMGTKYVFYRPRHVSGMTALHIDSKMLVQ